jgi:hypothetical protein
MVVTVLTTERFEMWLDDQTKQVQMQVTKAIGLLEQKGVTLGAPHSSAILGVDFALRELRPASGSSPARAFYAFDPDRNAIVLCGGSKNDSGDMYKTAKKTAENEWKSHLNLVDERKRNQSKEAESKPRRGKK